MAKITEKELRDILVDEIPSGYKIVNIIKKAKKNGLIEKDYFERVEEIYLKGLKDKNLGNPDYVKEGYFTSLYNLAKEILEVESND